MINQESTIRTQIIEICKLLHDKNYLAAADGNISYRIDDNRILITPSAHHKSFISPQDIAVVTLDGKTVSGHPSSELAMHLEIYRHQKKTRAIVHAHPPCAIAWSIAKPKLKELPTDSMSEVILGIGSIPIVPYTRPGTKKMGENIVPFLSQYKTFILARHGALSWGEDLIEALNGMERLEHSSLVLKYALEIEKISPLPPSEIKILQSMRQAKGNRSL